MIKQEFKVNGMHCAACELLIEKKLSKIDGVKKVDANLSTGKVVVESAKSIDSEDLNLILKEDGYSVSNNLSQKAKHNKKELVLAFVIALAALLLFALIQKLGIVNLASTDTINFPFIFLVGVVASLSSCMAVVGGLVLSISSSYSKINGKRFKPLVMFHLSRLVAFFVLGGIIGLLGSAFILTPAMNFVINILLFIVMISMALNLLDFKVMPIVPRFGLLKKVSNKIFLIKSKDNFIYPILLGVLTFLLPCGFTQSMQIYSLSTASFLDGALTMFIFALGTFPVLAIISFISINFSKSKNAKLFFKTSGFLVLFFAIFNFLSALVVVGLIDPIFF